MELGNYISIYHIPPIYLLPTHTHALFFLPRSQWNFILLHIKSLLRDLKICLSLSPKNENLFAILYFLIKILFSSFSFIPILWNGEGRIAFKNHKIPFHASSQIAMQKSKKYKFKLQKILNVKENVFLHIVKLIFLRNRIRVRIWKWKIW